MLAHTNIDALNDKECFLIGSRRIWEEKMKDYPEYQFTYPIDMHEHLKEGRVALVYEQILLEELPGYPCTVSEVEGGGVERGGGSKARFL